MKNGTANVEGGVLRGEPPVFGPDPRVTTLEERVRRLEDVVASLPDTRQMEQRVVESLTARARANGLRESAGLIIDAGRQLLPAAVGALKDGADAAEVDARDRARAATSGGRPWLPYDLYAELRAMARMYVDPRYRLGWQGRVLPVVLLAAIATSWIWLPGTAILPGIVSTLYMKVIDLALAFVLCKTIHREVRRYRETSPDLPPSLRL